jgi:hypothetical protein
MSPDLDAHAGHRAKLMNPTTLLNTAKIAIAALGFSCGAWAQQAEPAPVKPQYEKSPRSQPFKQLDPSRKSPSSPQPQQTPGSGGGGGGGGGGGAGSGTGSGEPNQDPTKQNPPPEKEDPSPDAQEATPPPTVPVVHGPIVTRNATIIRDGAGPHLVAPIDGLGLGSGAPTVDIEFYARSADGSTSVMRANIPGMPIERFRWTPLLPDYCVIDLKPEDASLTAAKSLQFGPGDWAPTERTLRPGERFESTWRVSAAPREPHPIVNRGTKGRGPMPGYKGGFPRIGIDPEDDGEASAAPFCLERTALLAGIGGEALQSPPGAAARTRVLTVIARDEVTRLIRDAKPLDQRAYLEHILASWGNPEGYRELAAFLKKNGYDAIASWRIESLDEDSFSDAYSPSPSPGGSARAIAALSEDRGDDLNMELLGRDGRGLGTDSNRARDAVIRIDDPVSAAAATRRLSASRVPGSPQRGPSNARVLIIEAAPTSSGAPRLPDLR